MATEFELFVLEYDLNQEWQECFKGAILYSPNGRKSCAFNETDTLATDDVVFLHWFVFIQTEQGADFWFGLMDWFMNSSPFERKMFFSFITPNEFKKVHWPRN